MLEIVFSPGSAGPKTKITDFFRVYDLKGLVREIAFDTEEDQNLRAICCVYHRETPLVVLVENHDVDRSRSWIDQDLMVLYKLVSDYRPEGAPKCSECDGPVVRLGQSEIFKCSRCGKIQNPDEEELWNICQTTYEEAPPCSTCGLTTIRSGEAWKCVNCGATTYGTFYAGL